MYFINRLSIYQLHHMEKQADLKKIIIVPSNRTTLFYLWMTMYFGLKRPSSDHHYKHFKIRCNTVQIMLVIWGPLWFTKFIWNYIKIRELVIVIVTVSKKYEELINIQNIINKGGFTLQVIYKFQKKTENTEDNINHKEKCITLEKVAFTS